MGGDEMTYHLWRRSKIAWSAGWEDTGRTFDRRDASYEVTTDGSDYCLLPEGTVPVDGYSARYNVRVPEGGYLAVVLKSGGINNETIMRLEKVMNEKTGIKTVVFAGDFSFMGVGPEEKK